LMISSIEDAVKRLITAPGNKKQIAIPYIQKKNRNPLHTEKNSSRRNHHPTHHHRYNYHPVNRQTDRHRQCVHTHTHTHTHTSNSNKNKSYVFTMHCCQDVG
jgi:hypothetical protein